MAQQASPPARRIRIWLVILLGLVLTGVLLGAYLLLTRRDMAVLASHLRAPEAAAIAQELDTEGVAYQVADAGATLLVPADQRDAVQLRIAGADLAIKGQEGFELFDSSELGLTEFAQRIKYQRALQGELARTIMKIDGVTDARIHISIPEQSVFRSERSPAKAAVTLLTRSADVETPEAISGIQELVAAAIPDLAPRDVVILNAHGAVISTSGVPDEATDSLRDLETAVRGIAPDARLRLVETPGTPAPGSDSAAAGQPPATPTPAKVVTALLVETSQALDTPSRDRIVGAILGAGLAGIRATQDIRFEVASRPTASLPAKESPAPIRAARQQIPQPAAAASGDVPVMLIAGGLIGVLGLAFLLAFALRLRHTRLSLADQTRFADRLRDGLKAQAAEVTDATA